MACWHLYIYKLYKFKHLYALVCGGTLISLKVVITAAHCVTEVIDKKQIPLRDPKILKVGVGKYYRSLYKSEDSLAQIVDVKSIESNQHYLGFQGRYKGDIAFITLKTEIKYTRAVRPICVDVDEDNFEQEHWKEGTIGKVVGWGLTAEKKTSDTLKIVDMPIVSNHECRMKIGFGLRSFLTMDKVCAGDISSIVNICTGDSGGGLVLEDPVSKAFYLCGIVSISRRDCKGADFTLFTNLTFHKTLVKKYLPNCKGVSYFRTCGRAEPQSAVTQAREIEDEEFAWNAGIYQYNVTSGAYDHICGGALISTRVVISAAHCVTIEDKNSRNLNITDKTTLKVAVGKYYKNLYDSRDSQSQIVEVAAIEISESYKGSKGNYYNDISFIILKTEIVFTRAVRSVCIDIGKDNFEEDQLRSGAMGKVLGWGITNPDEKSEKLKVVEMPYVTKRECMNKISNSLKDYVKGDKLCAGDQYSLTTLCKGDGGGGLVFEDQETKAYYLRGVVSFGECKGTEFVLFTKLSSHKKLVEKYAQDCKGDCNRSCGEAVSIDYKPFVSNGMLIEYAQFPWHAGIYEYDQELFSYKYICGGTLITNKIVITAAHCVTVEEKGLRKATAKNSSTLKVAVGKYYRDLNESKDNMAQIMDVKCIKFSPQYRGSINLYDFDIAFVALKSAVEYNWAVGPVCLDIGKKNFEKNQLQKGNTGKVVGWGTTENISLSGTLILAEMSFVPREECINKIGSTLRSFACVRDKICAGDQSSNMSVCSGDSGGGLFFEDPRTKAYYLRGIVSLGPKKCKGEEFVLFTKLSAHKDFIKKYLLST